MHRCPRLVNVTGFVLHGCLIPENTTANERKWPQMKKKSEPEHLAAIALQVGRGKDKARFLQFIEAGVLDADVFQAILERQQLAGAWQSFARLFLSDNP